MTLIYDVGLLLLDLYSRKLGEWQEADDEDAKEILICVKRITKRVRKSADYASEAHSTLGMLELMEVG